MAAISDRMVVSPPTVGQCVLTFDSGLGGLTVFRHITAMMEGYPQLYVADDLGFPYGDFSEDALVEHGLATLTRLVERFDPRLVVVACNTASTILLPHLRSAFDIPFVGTVPAIKPAAVSSQSGFISVLATPGTVKRDYTQALVDTYASHCDVTLVGATGLAALAERYLLTGEADKQAILTEIAPCFVMRAGRRTDVVVLACTHYPLLMDIFRAVAPWPVDFLDPAPAIAYRACSLLPPMPGARADIDFILTSGHPFPLPVRHQFSG